MSLVTKVVLTFACDWKANFWEEKKTIFCYERGDYYKMKKYFQGELKAFQIDENSIVEERWKKLKEINYKGKKIIYLQQK